MKAFLIESTTRLVPFGKPEDYNYSYIPGAINDLRNLYYTEIHKKGRYEPVLITFSEEEKARMMERFSICLPALDERHHMFHILKAITEVCMIGYENPTSVTSLFHLHPVIFKLTKSNDSPTDFGILLWAPPSDTFNDTDSEGICLLTQVF